GYDLLAAARGRQCPLGEEPAPREELVRGNAMAASYQGTVMPGSNVSSTIRTFSDAVQRRRRLTDVIISTRSAGLVIDTVVCHLPSGRPGPVGSGAVSSRSPNSADRGQTFKRLAHYLIWIKSDLVPGCGALATIRQFCLFGLFCALLITDVGNRRAERYAPV